MTRNRLYTIVSMVTISGLLYALYCYYRALNSGFGLCIFKNITGYPCPSCGTTRSIRHLFQGEFYKALVTNPLGYIMLGMGIFVPLWVLYDYIAQKSSFFHFYQKAEAVIRKRPIAFILIGLIFANWIWNIYKKI